VEKTNVSNLITLAITKKNSKLTIMLLIWFRVSTSRQHATKNIIWASGFALTTIAILRCKVELKTNNIEYKEWC
jgi:hypothetical protein